MPPHGRSSEALAVARSVPRPLASRPGALHDALAFRVGPRVLLGPLLVLAVILATGLGLGWWLADRLVREDARFVAASTSDLLRKLVPGLETILETGTATAEQRGALVRAADRSRVVAVALLDRTGRPILGGREILPTAPSPLPDDATARALVAEALAQRDIRAAVRPVHAPGWPAHVGEAVVPIARDGRLAGLLQVSVDLSDKVAVYRSTFIWSSIVVAALFLLAAAVPGFFLWRRLEALEAAAAEVRHLAFHDPLTDLPNRLLFQDRLAQAIARVRREGGRGALLILDLDDFKAVNDAHGHAAGDQLLRAVARRLTRAVRATDTVARLGGDEFALVIAPLASLDGLDPVLDRLRRELARPVTVDDRPLVAGATIGIALFPDDGDEPDPLIRRADGALYRGKAKGRGTIVWHREPPAEPPGRPPRAPAG
ncbi:MAG: GGDEF domain-containing protein [Geminicoccaceae bacterium]|nr:GGDEF domain-containing protein [Geminicoccaceae bacterium]